MPVGYLLTLIVSHTQMPLLHPNTAEPYLQALAGCTSKEMAATPPADAALAARRFTTLYVLQNLWWGLLRMDDEHPYEYDQAQRTYEETGMVADTIFVLGLCLGYFAQDPARDFPELTVMQNMLAQLSGSHEFEVEPETITLAGEEGTVIDAAYTNDVGYAQFSYSPAISCTVYKYQPWNLAMPRQLIRVVKMKKDDKYVLWVKDAYWGSRIQPAQFTEPPFHEDFDLGYALAVRYQEDGTPKNGQGISFEYGLYTKEDGILYGLLQPDVYCSLVWSDIWEAPVCGGPRYAPGRTTHNCSYYGGQAGIAHAILPKYGIFQRETDYRDESEETQSQEKKRYVKGWTAVVQGRRQSMVGDDEVTFDLLSGGIQGHMEAGEEPAIARVITFRLGDGMAAYSYAGPGSDFVPMTGVRGGTYVGYSDVADGGGWEYEKMPSKGWEPQMVNAEVQENGELTHVNFKLPDHRPDWPFRGPNFWPASIYTEFGGKLLIPGTSAHVVEGLGMSEAAWNYFPITDDPNYPYLVLGEEMGFWAGDLMCAEIAAHPPCEEQLKGWGDYFNNQFPLYYDSYWGLGYGYASINTVGGRIRVLPTGVFGKHFTHDNLQFTQDEIEFKAMDVMVCKHSEAYEGGFAPAPGPRIPEDALVGSLYGAGYPGNYQSHFGYNTWRHDPDFGPTLEHCPRCGRSDALVHAIDASKYNPIGSFIDLDGSAMSEPVPRMGWLEVRWVLQPQDHWEGGTHYEWEGWVCQVNLNDHAKCWYRVGPKNAASRDDCKYLQLEAVFGRGVWTDPYKCTGGAETEFLMGAITEGNLVRHSSQNINPNMAEAIRKGFEKGKHDGFFDEVRLIGNG